MLAFDSNLAPIVGQQVTLGSTSGVDSQNRLATLIQRATFVECDLIVKGVLAGEERGWLLVVGVFQSDRLTQTHTDAELRAQAAAGDEAHLHVRPARRGRAHRPRSRRGRLLRRRRGRCGLGSGGSAEHAQKRSAP